MATGKSEQRTFFKREIVLEAILFLLQIQWVCFRPPLAAYFNLQLRKEIKVRTTGPTNYGLFFEWAFKDCFTAVHGHTWWFHANCFDCVEVLLLFSLYKPHQSCRNFRDPCLFSSSFENLFPLKMTYSQTDSNACMILFHLISVFFRQVWIFKLMISLGTLLKRFVAICK